MADRQFPSRRAPDPRSPRSTSRRLIIANLPKLADGPFAGLPRVFGLVWAFVAHTDSRFDLETWCALHARLPGGTAAHDRRIVGVGDHPAHRARRESEADRRAHRLQPRERREADAIADRLLGADASRADGMRCWSTGSAQTARPTRLSSSWSIGCAIRTRSLRAMLERLDERLAADGRTTDSAVQDEQQRQIAANVTVRNIITSMRHISDVDWTVMFERVSLVDPVLARGCDFAKMDFATRNLYRTAVEQLARGSGLEELEVAHRAVQAAAAATERRRRDPGYYLIAEGRPGVRGGDWAFGRPFWTSVGRAYRALGIGGYVGAGAVVACCCSASRSSSASRPVWTGYCSACSGCSARCRRSTRPSRWSTGA